MAQKRTRISWKQEGVEKTFLETCLHEITLHGKNRYDYIKSKFSSSSKLKNTTGNVYNHVTNTFNLSKEEWQIEIK
ncbi:hypothetical protein R6Q59_035965, partial [Mikania micrantha]